MINLLKGHKECVPESVENNLVFMLGSNGENRGRIETSKAILRLAAKFPLVQ